MALPTYEDCMLPLLQVLASGELISMKEATHRVADHFELTAEERERRLPSGQQSYIANRVAWAKTYLKKAGLVDNPKRGHVRLSPAGRAVLGQNPQRIDNGFLANLSPEFVEFVDGQSIPEDILQEPIESSEIEQTPDEAIQTAYSAIRKALADELLEQVQNCSPLFFERLVLDLLRAMGYGGAVPDAGQHVGRSGDGGIDGIINEDKLGLDSICIQAKRWKDTVGRPTVQGFAGSMEAHRAKKGVMITTSTFSREAHEYVRMIERRIVLIEGLQLAQLMIDHNVGVSSDRVYTVKKIDSDYFSEDFA